MSDYQTLTGPHGSERMHSLGSVKAARGSGRSFIAWYGGRYRAVTVGAVGALEGGYSGLVSVLFVDSNDEADLRPKDLEAIRVRAPSRSNEVYVVTHEFDYEGGTPVRVFRHQEDAQEFARQKLPSGESYNVTPFEIQESL